MQYEEELLLKLKQLLKFKESKDFYAKRLGVSKLEVEDLLFKLRNKKEDNIINEYSEEVKKINREKGTLESIVLSLFEPKNDIELAELHKIDLKKYKIVNYWSKLLPSGKFTSSVLCKFINEIDILFNDYLKDLKQSLLSIERYDSPINGIKTEKALFVYIADDHVGIDFENSYFSVPFSKSIYFDRLDELANRILLLKQDVDVLHIVNMGDQLDGYNKLTTRGTHKLDSDTNKNQFDIYTKARKVFYDKLIQSNKFQEVTIINLLNSNHDGNSFSYIVNKALEFYLEAKYSNVFFINQDKFIDTYIWGNHALLLSHGKDEKFMRQSMPLNLDNKTDLWILDYIKDLPDKYISTIKADLHQYSVNMGKSGRYVNVPSICGGSSFIELNFGSSKAGCLIEVIDTNSSDIISIPIWF